MTAIQVFHEIESGGLLAVSLLPLIPMVMALFGILMVKSGKWFSRNNIAYISGVIESTLNEKDEVKR
jgi:hypothetical protein